MNKLYAHLQPARKAIQSCEIVYRCLGHICIMVTEPGDSISIELARHLYQLIRWIRVMDTRKREPSGADVRAERLH
jgi:hypothetical protein